jgi:hypothetical protein
MLEITVKTLGTASADRVAETRLCGMCVTAIYTGYTPETFVSGRRSVKISLC